MPIHYAAKFLTSNLLATLKLLLDNGANPNGSEKAITTPLHYICHFKVNAGKSAVELLLQYGADLNFKSAGGISSYLYDLVANHRPISETSLLEFFLEKGADPNSSDNYCKMTLVHCAVRSHVYGEPKALQILLKRGGNPNAVDECNKTPVHLAAQKSDWGAENVLRLLLDHGGNPNSVDNTGNTPVHYAAMNESETGPKLLEIALKNKTAGDPNIVYQNGKTLVHYAAENKAFNNRPKSYLNILEFLLSKKCDPNKPDDEGRTPVHLLAANKSGTAWELLNCLLQHGGDLNVTDKKGKKPIDYARILSQQFFGKLKMLEILEEYEKSY